MTRKLSSKKRIQAPTSILQSKDRHHQDNETIRHDILQQQGQSEDRILHLTYEIQNLRLDYMKGIRQFSLDYDYLSAKKRLQMIRDLNVRQAVVVAKDITLSHEKGEIGNLHLQGNLPLKKRPASPSQRPNRPKTATWNLVPYPDPPAGRPLREEIEITRLGTMYNLESDLHPLALGSLDWTRRFFQKGKGEPKELIPDYGDEAPPRNMTSLIKAVRACITARKGFSGETEAAETDGLCWNPVSLDDRRVVVLLILRADIVRDERDVHGMTALDYACLAGDEFLLAVLEAPEPPLFTRLLLAVSEGEIDVVRDLVEANPEVYSLLLDKDISGLRVVGRRANEKVMAYGAYLEHSDRAAAGEDSVYAGVSVYYGIIKILLKCEGVEAECDVVDDILEQVEQSVFAERDIEMIELLRSVRKVSLE